MNRVATILAMGLVTTMLGCEQRPSSAAAVPPSQAPAMRVSVMNGRASLSSCGGCDKASSPTEPALLVAHGGSGEGIRVEQQGAGEAAVLSTTRTDNRRPTLDVTRPASANPVAHFRGGRVELGAGAALVYAVARVAAGDRITVPDDANVLAVEEAPGQQANMLVLPRGSEGQLLFVYNGDGDPLVTGIGGEGVAPGAVRHLLFVMGHWRLVG